VNGGDDRALQTDLYELTMASVYQREGLDTPATFELFVRRLPEGRNFLVAAGLEQALEYLVSLRFAPEHIDHLRSLGSFDETFLHSLMSLRFTGDAWAMPEGTCFFANEPVLRITAPRIQAQIVETFLLTMVNYQSMVASKAARLAIASSGRPFVDFSGRRDHGPEAGVLAARAAYIGGAAATSSTAAGLRFGIPLSGTMAHSFVMSFDDEVEAFCAYMEAFPDGATLLIDTYDTIEGAKNAVAAAQRLEGRARLGAVRIDSGDLAADAARVRAILDEAGFNDVRIFVSGDLDELAIAALLASGAPVDAFGVGTRLGVSSDAPFLPVVYKLVADDKGARLKLSPDKQTLPGAKQVWREYREGAMVRDVIALEGEKVDGGEPLLIPVVRGGELVAPPEALEAVRARCAAQVAALAPALRSLDVPATYPVDISGGLLALQRRLSTSHRPEGMKPRITPGVERPRDRFGRPLAWDAEPELEMHDYDGMPLEANLALAVDAFNAGVYFTAHEAWEAAWRKSRGGANEEFFKGLAQLGAGYTHMQRGNARGARTLLARALDRLSSHRPHHHGLDLDVVCEALETHIAAFASDEAAGRRATRVQTPSI